MRAMRGAPENADRVTSEMHLEAVIERVWRYALGGRDRASLEIHLEAVIV